MLSDFAGAMDGGNDLGSLADELAEAWDEDAQEEEEVVGQDMDEQFNHTPFGASEAHCQANGSGLSPAFGRAMNGVISPKKITDQSRARGRRRGYNGSHYSDDSEPEQDSGISHTLEARIATIERLAQQGTEGNDSRTVDVIERVVDGLRDLGAQSSVENGTTRSVLPLHDKMTP